MRTGKSRFDLGEDKNKKIAHLYQDGYEVGGIAQRFGISKAQVLNIAKRYVPARRIRGRKEDYRDAF